MSKMIKTSDLSEVLNRLGTSAKSTMSNTGEHMQDWWQNLNPEARSAIERGLTGAAIGGGLTGTMAGLTPKAPGEHKGRNVVRSALLGSLMGGVGAAGFPVAEKMFGGEIRFKGEPGKDVLSKYLVDPVIGVPIHHPFAAAGTVAGGAMFGTKTLPFIQRAMPKVSITKSIIDAVRNRDATNLRQILSIATRQAGSEASAASHGASGVIARAKGLAKAGPYAIPAGLLGGMLLDKYLKGNT